jgi:probable FeS assembly SUF system protein SufT
MKREETTITRDVEVIQVPYGESVTIAAGTPAVITQALGDTWTIELPTLGGLYRVARRDGDAIGKTVSDGDPAAAPAGPLQESQVWDALRNVYDPEIPVNVVELGLVYGMAIEDQGDGTWKVGVTMTLTAPGCGMGPVIAEDAKQRIEGLPGVVSAEVNVVFDPPWGPQMMSEAAKLELGWL